MFENDLAQLTLTSLHQRLKQDRLKYVVESNANMTVVNVEKGNPFKQDPLLSEFDSISLGFDKNDKLFVLKASHNSHDESFSNLIVEKLQKIYGPPKTAETIKNKLEYKFENKEHSVTITVIDFSDSEKQMPAQMQDYHNTKYNDSKKVVVPEKHYAVLLEYIKKT